VFFVTAAPVSSVLTFANGSSRKTRRDLFSTIFSTSQETTFPPTRSPEFHCFATNHVPIHLEVDKIYNMACRRTGHYNYNPIKTIKTSGARFGSTCSASLKRCGRKFCRPSTSEVYGDPVEHPQTNLTAATSTRSASGPVMTKAQNGSAETLFMDYHRSNGVDLASCEFSNTYGHACTLGRRVGFQLHSAKPRRGRHPRLFGDGFGKPDRFAIRVKTSSR